MKELLSAIERELFAKEGLKKFIKRYKDNVYLWDMYLYRKLSRPFIDSLI